MIGSRNRKALMIHPHVAESAVAAEAQPVAAVAADGLFDHNLSIGELKEMLSLTFGTTSC